MAQLINVKLSRFDAQPWGFRLQGGKDFGTPLLIQKVTGGSLAEKAGLQAGDAVIKVNTTDLFNLRHKDAQDAIVRAGNNFEITVQRGGSTWKPAVTPVGALPSINSAAQPASIPPVTKTSLAARPQATGPLASGYNVAAKPFGGPQVNGSLGDGTVKSIVNKQYNTPVGIYSEETIAETLSAQAEVLAGGVLGVNFKKNEKSYNPGNSEVLKLLQEIDNEPRESEPDTALSPAPTSVTSPPVTGLRHVSAPETRSTPTTPHEDPFKILPPGQNICADCERLIVGVFVRIKDKNLHVECFKCATCGSSLKNVGYYNINNKLYCDIHAKLVARQHPPAPNLEPITIPPGGKAPAGAISAALAGAPGLRQGPAAAPAPRPVPAPAPAPAPALAPSSVQAPAAPGSPQTLGPVPFHTPSGAAPPKPFSAPTAPTTSPARPAPASNKFVWPPKREEESISPGPTATPLYIPPVPLHHTKELSTAHPSSMKSQQILASTITNFQQTFNAQASISHDVQPLQPSVPPVSFPPQPVQNMKDQISAFPLPYSDFVSTQKAHQMRPVSSPTPSSQQKTLFQPPAFDVNPLPIQAATLSKAPQGLSPEQVSQEEIKVQTKKASVCSQEVSLITDSKSVGAVEKISESLETQTLVSAIIQSERPPSPTPTVQTEEIPQVTPEENSLPNKEKIIEKDQSHEETFSEKISEKVTEQEDSVSTEKTQNDLYQEQEQQKLLQQQLQNQQQHIVQTHLQKEIPAIKSLTTVESSELNSLTTIEQQEQTQIYKETVKGLEETLELSQTVSKEILSTSTSASEEIKPPPSANTVPKEWQSSLLVALTTAPERSYSPFPAVTQAPAFTTQSNPSIEFKENLGKSLPQPLSYKQLPTQAAGAFRPIATDAQVAICQEVSQLTSMSQNIPVPSTIPAPVPLPKQTVPYHPKIEIGSSNAMSRSSECYSPMVQALTVAPERSYSPLPGATKPQTPTLQHTSTVAKSSTAIQPQSTVLPVVPKPFEHIEPQLPLLPTPSKHMSMLEALTVAPDRSYSPFASQSIQAPTPSQPPNTVVQSEASAFTAVSPQSVMTGPKTASPKFISANPALFKPLPKSNISPRPQSRTPIPSPRPASRSSLPVMGGFRPTVPSGTSQAESQDIGYQDYQSSYSQTSSVQENPQSVEVVDLGDGRIVTKRTHVEESFSHTHKEMQKTIQRSHGQAPIVKSSQSQQNYEQTSKLQQTFVNDQEVKRSQEQKQHTSSFGSGRPQSLPFYQKDIERFREQRAISPAPHSVQMRALSPVPQGARPMTPNLPSQISKPVNLTPHSQTLPHPKKSGVSFQTQASSTTVSNQEGLHQKMYSLTTAPKPGVIPFYQKDIERYQMQRAMSPLPASQLARSSPLPSQQGNHPPQPASSLKFQQQQQQVYQEKQQQVLQQQVQKQHVQVQQTQKQGQKEQLKPQQQQQLGQNLNQNQPARPISPFFGLPQPSIIPFYQRDIERYQTQRALSPAPHSQSMRALSPTPSTQPTTYQQHSSLSSAPHPATFGDSTAYNQGLNAPQKIGVPAPLFKPKPLTSLPLSSPTFLPQASQQASHLNSASRPSTVTKPPAPTTSSSIPNAGVGGGVGGGPGQKGSATFAGSSAPRRGRGVLNQQTPGARIPLCGFCNSQIRGPFITALGKIWCPEHFVCVNGQCRRPLQDIGFVEEKGELYCEYCFEQFIAPSCDKCSKKIKEDCVKAIGKHFHPECFLCAYCGKLFGNTPFFLEDGLPYCETDWNELFTTKCFACGFPIEAGDRWVEALNNNYHSQCFNCTNCKKNLEGQSFYAKGGRPFCKAHAR